MRLAFVTPKWDSNIQVAVQIPDYVTGKSGIKEYIEGSLCQAFEEAMEYSGTSFKNLTVQMS